MAYLRLEHLQAVAGSQAVLDLFDDSGRRSPDDDSPFVVETLARAEAEAASYLLGNYGEEALAELATADPAFVSHVAWVAMQFATERRPEFVTDSGAGRYQAQYDRAVAFFKNLARSNTRSVAKKAGSGAQSGGKVNPPLPRAGAPRFVFAADKNNPRGGGGF